jgi:hypothetical protein
MFEQVGAGPRSRRYPTALACPHGNTRAFGLTPVPRPWLPPPQRLFELNPNQPYLSYEPRDVMNFVESMPHVGLLV